MALMTMQKPTRHVPGYPYFTKLAEFGIFEKEDMMQTIRNILSKDRQNADAYLIDGNSIRRIEWYEKRQLFIKKSTRNESIYDRCLD